MLAKKKSRVIGALIWPRSGRNKHDKDVPVVSTYGRPLDLLFCLHMCVFVLICVWDVYVILVYMCFIRHSEALWYMRRIRPQVKCRSAVLPSGRMRMLMRIKNTAFYSYTRCVPYRHIRMHATFSYLLHYITEFTAVILNSFYADTPYTRVH